MLNALVLSHSTFYFCGFCFKSCIYIWCVVIGTAFALNILFKVPVWAGVLFTGLSTLLLLGLQRYGVIFNFILWCQENFHLLPYLFIYLFIMFPLNWIGDWRGQVRKLEMLIAGLVFIMAGCFFAEMSYVKPPASRVIKGMLIPKLKGSTATTDAIALFGALVMP